MKRLILVLPLMVIACSSKPPLDRCGLDVPGSIVLTASGEVFALEGYDFPPKQDGDPAFVDGWQVKFDRVLVTIDKVRISDNPDLYPGDQARTGPVLASLDGPWAIDLAKRDPSNLQGKGSPGEEAAQFACVNPGLATDGTRFAFGYDVTAASKSAKRVNLDMAASAEYDRMITDGCTVLYSGIATYIGNASCTLPSTFPQVVPFRFCFKSPVSYVNCQNPDNTGAAFPGDESQRGIALDGSKGTIAQVTIHTDHPFWDSVLHDAPLHFDQFAARAANDGTVTLEDTKGVDFTAFTDRAGNPLKWRYCIEPPTDVHPKFTGLMSFDPQSVKMDLRDYYDFATYDQSTQGHLNSDGLCATERHR